MKHKARLQFNQPVLFLIGGIALVMEILDPSRIWMVLLVGIGFTWAISYYWARELAENLSLKREMRFGWTQVGDRLEERYLLKNDTWVPALWIEVNDHSDLPGYNASLATGIEGNAEKTWHSDGICTQRGLYRLGPSTLRTSDPFGLYSVTLEVPGTHSLMVLPPTLLMPELRIFPAGLRSDGLPRQNTAETAVSAASVRAYEPGDTLHAIHWPTSARRQSLFVRIFDGTPGSDWRILLDLDSSVQAGTGWNSTIENGVILAASLADRALRQQLTVGLSINGQTLTWSPVYQGVGARWEILRLLALAKSGNTPLGDWLGRLGPELRQQTSLVIITPAVQGAWIEPLMQLTWRGIRPTLLLLDVGTFQTDENDAHIQGAARRLANLLAINGIECHIISRQFLDRPEARPGQVGRWEWRYTALGKAVPVRQPEDQSWKTIS